MMGWALITHPDRATLTHRGLLAPMVIEERFVPVACAQGWIVVAADVDVAPDIGVITQSNPRRTADDTEDA